MAGTLYITDGTTIIDLKDAGLALIDWTPMTSPDKAGGVWASSPLTDGRQLSMRKKDNIIDVFTSTPHSYGMDDTIYNTQELRRLLEKAVSYWLNNKQPHPVWIEARGSCETNTRYAIIHNYSTPNDDNPYMQPFAHSLLSAMDGFTVAIEHGPWLAYPPGQSACLSISGQQEWEYPWYLEFQGNGVDVVNCGSGATLDDLPDGATGFTIEAWVYAHSWGGGGGGTIGAIANKRDFATSAGWYFEINNADGLRGHVFYSGNDAISTSGPGAFTLNTWHHVAMGYEDTVNRVVRLWIDGVEVAYVTQQASTVNYDADAAFNFLIGNDDTGDGWDGYIGWTRLLSREIYTAPFTPPARCYMPALRSSVVGQWIQEGTGTTAYNQIGTAGTDGTITAASGDPLWDTDCTRTAGRTETCAQEVYIANKHNQAQLTRIFYYDNSTATYSANFLAGGLPYDFLPAIPAVNDIVYFGIGSTVLNGGPFCSLVFNISVAATNITTIVWEYWNGAAWVAIPTLYSTVDRFTVAGVGSVQWAQPSDWAATLINAATCYWVRARVTAVGGAPTPPRQATRHIYTVDWPYIELDAQATAGDITALAKALLTNNSYSTTDFSRLVLGTRTVGMFDESTVDDFDAFINLSDEQNGSAVAITVAGGTTVFTNNLVSPTGRVVRWTPAAAVAMSYRIRVDLSATPDYLGRFRAFLRVTQSGGASGDFSARYCLRDAAATFYRTGKTVTLFATDSVGLDVLDLGIIDMSGENYEDTDTIARTIEIQAANTNGAPGTLDFYDLILIPIDEFSLDTTYRALPITSTTASATVLDISSLDIPKKQITSRSRMALSGNQILEIWGVVASDNFVLQANAKQRVWFFKMDKSILPTTSYWRSHFDQIGTVQMYHNDRYISMRGNR